MNTQFYQAWRAAMQQRDQALYILLVLAVILVGSYLITYVNWVPDKWGRRLRATYEIGGALLYLGMLIVSILGS